MKIVKITLAVATTMEIVKITRAVATTIIIRMVEAASQDILVSIVDLLVMEI